MNTTLAPFATEADVEAWDEHTPEWREQDDPERFVSEWDLPVSDPEPVSAEDWDWFIGETFVDWAERD